MEDRIMNQEAVEQAEQNLTPEQQNQMMELYMENAREAEEAGNEDMAEYYRDKMEKLEAQNGAGDTRLGGWYAGYTPAEWRRFADKEYASNGNSMRYRELISNAQKAEG